MKNYLVLEILEGRDWNPNEGSRTVIEAHLNNEKLSTNEFPLTNSPKFNTEVAWEAEKQIFRSYKLNRIPIKIVCYALDEKTNRKILGYIVLPLTSAVEGVEGDSKWYKLLGGSKGSYKTPPSILLRLHMEAMKLDQHNQMNGKETSEKNGSRSANDCQISSITEKKNKILHQANLKDATGKANGNGETQQFIQYTLQNSYHMNASNGNFVQNVEEGTNEIDSDNMEEGEVEEEELLDSEGEYLEEDDDDALGMIAGAYSLKTYEENEHTSGSDTMDEPVSYNSGEPIPTHSNSIVISNGKADVHTCKTTDNTYPQKGETVSVNDPEVDQLNKTRASAMDYLKKLSENSLSSYRERHKFESSSLIRRISDTSSLLDISCGHKSKSRKLDNSIEISCNDSLNKSENVCEKENVNTSIKNKLSQNKDATVIGIFLSQSIGETSSEHKQREDFSNCKYSVNAKLVPELNQEEGCFYIASEPGDIEEFLFSVSITYAKNLRKIIPEASSSSANEGYRFCYSLLGYPIYTDPFSNLDAPEFVAQKVSAKVRTSHKSLSLYFGQHPFLPVYFMSGEDVLGVCNVDLGCLMDVATNNVKFEDVYQVNSMNDRQDLSKTDSRHKPVVAIAIEVLKSNENINLNIPHKSEKHSNCNINEVYVSDSASSSSELNEDFKHKSKSRKSKRRYSLKNYLNEEKALNAEMSFEREKKFMLLKAAYEIEQWKEEKHKLFIKDWSAKEETFQRLLASEWSSKVKLIEEELNHRISECDKLQEKLNKGLDELSVREEKCKWKESQNKRLEEELLAEREKLQLQKFKDTSHGNEVASANEISTKRLQLVKQRNEQLEEEVRRLKDELRITNETLNVQSQEVINLRKKLVLSDDLIGASSEKEFLQKKIDHLQDRKQYYKGQWLSVLTDFHKLHSQHKRTINEISCANENLSGEEPDASSSSSSTTGIKLKKLKDKRQILIKSGHYSPNHSIIKNIDKKIKELIGIKLLGLVQENKISNNK
ncbi:Centrosomal protein, partial [Armadillidium vulgare]